LIIAPLAAYAFWGLTYGYTNYAYNNYGWGRGVYVGGPRYGYYNAYAARPINQYNIQRNVAFRNGGVNNFRPGQPVNGTMPVFAPRVNAANSTALKPAVVKAKVPPGQVQKGWEGAKGNPTQIQQAKAVTQAQAAKAAPARLPSAQARAIGPVGGAPAGGAALGGAPVGGSPGGVVPKNQLSPQNAAAVQANQAGKGLPASVPAGAGAAGAAKAGGQLPAVQNNAAANNAALKGAKGSKVHTESATGTSTNTKKTTSNASLKTNTSHVNAQGKTHTNTQHSTGPKVQSNKAKAPKAAAAPAKPKSKTAAKSAKPKAKAKEAAE
jgi:hypothetical protein